MVKPVIKKILKNNALWALIAVVLNAAINFLIVPYMTERIGVEAYGFVTLGNTLITYVDIISIALNAFAGRYIAIEYHRGDIRKANLYFSSIILADLLLCIIIAVPAIVMIIFLPSMLNIPVTLVGDVKILFYILLFRYCMVLIRTGFDVAAFIKNRLDITEKYRTISYLIQAALLLVTCGFFSPHVWYVGLGSASAATFLFFVQVLNQRRLVPELTFSVKSFSGGAVIDLISAGLWNSINNLGNLLNNGLDLLIANRLLSAIAMGMISVAETLGSLCYTIVTAFSNSFRPKQLKSYSENNIPKLTKQLQDAMRITGIVCAVIVGGFLSCGIEFFQLWLPNQNYHVLYDLTVITLLSTVTTGVVNPLYYVFTLTKKLIIPCIITIFMGIINVIGMIINIKVFHLGAYSIVLTTMILNFVHFVDTPIYAAYCLRLPFRTFYKEIIQHAINTTMVGVILYSLNYFYPAVSSWNLLFLKIIVYGFLGVLVSVLVLYSKQEKIQMVRFLIGSHDK